MKKMRFIGGVSSFVLLSFLLFSSLEGVLSKETTDPDKESFAKAGKAFTKTSKQTDEATKAKIQEAYGKLSLYFIQNDGQMGESVKYYVKTPGQTLYFAEEGMAFALIRGKGQGAVDKKEGKDPSVSKERLVFTLNLKDTEKDVQVTGYNKQEAKVNYLIGSDKRKWRSNIPTYGGVIYKEIYKGIDLKIYGRGRALETEFIVKPGADPKEILLSYEGIDGLRVNERGELIIQTAFGELKETKPYVYQEIDGKKIEITGEFKVKSKKLKAEDKNPKYEIQNQTFTYGFQIASYNKKYPLIIDPTLDYSTYLGGGGDDLGRGIAVDSSGNAYVTGYTDSGAVGDAEFPTTIGAYRTGFIGATYDAFVTKLNSDGSGLVYSTYLGGENGKDYGWKIAVDSSGNAYVTGDTYSTDFPTTAGAYQGSNAGASDAFVTKLNSDGSDLSYSTYLGGSSNDHARGISLDSSGNAYVTGDTYSTDFPTTAGAYQGSKAGKYDAFVTKLNSSGSGLSYSTYLGGSGDDFSYDIKVHGDNAFVTGWTGYGGISFPTTAGAYQESRPGGLYDAFVTKLNSSGSGLSYSTYLGGSNTDYGRAIAVDSSGNAFVTGHTKSADFPTTAEAYDTTCGTDGACNSLFYDAFVTGFNSAGTSLVYSTYLGGSGHDYGFGIAVDITGREYVTGYTDSTDFPTANPIQESYAGGNDVFVSRIYDGTLFFSTYHGGGSEDYNDHSHSIAVTSSGNIYVTGDTNSIDFPVTSGAFDTTCGVFGDYCNNIGETDAFVFRMHDSDATLIELAYFTATPSDSSVLLEWETAMEIDNAGFNIWRSEAEDGEYVKINDFLIPAQGSGSYYSYTDEDVTNGTTYYYQLEDVDLHGVSSFHEPVSAIPNKVVLLSPDDGAVLSSESPPTFEWASESYTLFKLVFKVKGRKLSGRSANAWKTDTTFNPSSDEWGKFANKLQRGQVIYWSVKGRDEHGNKTQSVTQSFTLE